MMASPNGVSQGSGNIDLRTYVGYYDCPHGTGSACTLRKQILMHGIYGANDAAYIQGWPVGGKLGMLTAYCENDDRAHRCPQWAVYSLTHPGLQNPYPVNRSASGPGPTESPDSRSHFGDDAPEQPARDGELVAYQYSYEPLPPEITF